MNIPLHNKSIKLAGLYLTIIMAISLFFSANIYQLSLEELRRGLQGPQDSSSLRPIGPGFSAEIREEIIAERQQLYNEAKQRVLERLFIVNLLIVLGGGALSYYLALRTLQPIEEAHDAQNRFTADASHELRTPITAMLTENEVTLMDPNLTLTDAKKQIESNIEELQHLTTLSDGLMRLAGLDNTSLIMEKFIVDDMLQGAIDRIQAHADTKAITITLTIPKVPVELVGDQHNLQEVVVILLDNAIKYSPAQSAVSVTLKTDQKQAVIAVADTGIGIKATDIPHVFDRFYRADSSRTKQQIHGYGLGLAIAHDIVQQHHGAIQVKSTPHKGSTFTITLPR